MVDLSVSARVIRDERKLSPREHPEPRLQGPDFTVTRGGPAAMLRAIVGNHLSKEGRPACGKWKCEAQLLSTALCPQLPASMSDSAAEYFALSSVLSPSSPRPCGSCGLSGEVT